MTQNELERQVAQATGESRRTIGQRGFTLYETNCPTFASFPEPDESASPHSPDCPSHLDEPDFIDVPVS